MMILFGYVPSGMSPEQYKKLKEKEKKSKSNKDFGRYGPNSFQSRSMQSFQKDLEKGKVRYNTVQRIVVFVDGGVGVW